MDSTFVYRAYATDAGYLMEEMEVHKEYRTQFKLKKVCTLGTSILIKSCEKHKVYRTRKDALLALYQELKGDIVRTQDHLDRSNNSVKALEWGLTQEHLLGALTP